MRSRNHPTPSCDKEKQGEMKWYIQEKDQLITEKVKKRNLYCTKKGGGRGLYSKKKHNLSLDVKSLWENILITLFDVGYRTT